MAKFFPVVLMITTAVLFNACKEFDSGDPVVSICDSIPYVTDADSNVYNVVQIGSQCWVKENLRTTRYRNGSLISPGDYTVYDNDSANDAVYGKLDRA